MLSKPNQKTSNYLQISALILIVALLASLYFMPMAIEYSDYRLIKLIPFAISFGAIPCLIIVALVLQYQTFKPYFIAVAFLTLLIVSAVSNIWRSNRRADEFAINGIWGKAIVMAQKQRALRGTAHHQVKCSYSINNYKYETSFLNDDTKSDKIGDTIPIFYSKVHPQIYHLDVERNGRYY